MEPLYLLIFAPSCLKILNKNIFYAIKREIWTSQRPRFAFIYCLTTLENIYIIVPIIVKLIFQK